ncbi:MAG: hypothetical protein D6675_01960 [Gemmatimonadetes bacterium]|nr:MAG: hypothetical protein D6675_01960 [Gemmatimonadota bacterium]
MRHILLLMICTSFSGCGGINVPEQQLYLTLRHQAEVLQQSCAEQGVITSDVAEADALLAQAHALIQTGKNQETRKLLDRAVLLYRLALLKRDFDESEYDLDQQRRALKTIEEQLSLYKEILKQVEAEKTP